MTIEQHRFRKGIHISFVKQRYQARRLEGKF